MLSGAVEQALRDALAEVRGPLDDVMGALGPVLDALPEEFPELPVDLPASDCPYVNALRDALARQLAGAGNALGNAGTALGAANSMFEQAGRARDDADALAYPAVEALAEGRPEARRVGQAGDGSGYT